MKGQPVNHELAALYEVKRQSFLIGFIQNPDHFNPALAFAYFNRVAPIFNEYLDREAHGFDPFDAVYAVKADFVESVTKFVDKHWLAKNFSAIGFYDLEANFGGHHTNRVELIKVLEYARIAGGFDEATWKAIEANAPIEATDLAAKFSPSDVYFG